MLYSMPLVADDGRRFHLDGYKQIRDEDGLDLWTDTTTLYVTVHEGEGTRARSRPRASSPSTRPTSPSR